MMDANDTRMQDLLIDRILFGADADQGPDDAWDEFGDFDFAAAALALTGASADEAPPVSLRRRLEDDAISWLAASRGLQMTADPPIRPNVAPAPAPADAPGVAGLLKFVAPWLIAAACIAIVAVGQLAPTPLLTPQAHYARLADRPDVTQWDWSSQEGVAGDVVWDPTAQAGVMRLIGLPANDPDVMQYQLWIVDGSRAGSPPIDGGVFDVADDGVVYIPVDAKLPIGDVNAFAITTEPPGGVVEHKDDPDRGLRFVATAAPQA